ncbi:hypothetical protein B296_00047654, partial [Ensete ventricosum]
NGVADNLSLKELLVRGTGEKVSGILSQDDQVGFWISAMQIWQSISTIEILQNSFGVVGMDDPNFISLDKALKDDKRIRYHADYLSNLQAAIE